ncbi:MAG: hypothetical protein ACE5EG_02560 [Thermoanaerobaculia bacterium]
MRTTFLVTGTLTLLALALTGCGAGTNVPAAAERVESPDLGLAIAALPAAFEVAENMGETLRLTAAEVDGASVEITVGPLQLSGINLVEVAKARRSEFEGEGKLYFGNRELMTPNGPAYTTRGQLTSPDGPVEVTSVYSLHADGSDRLMTVTYRYPGGGDSQARVAELLELLGEIEAL